MQLIRMHKRIEEKVIPKADTIRVDSISADTLPQQKAERLTPLQMRESQPKEKKIHVTKESLKPIKPNQTIPARTNRRR